MGWVEGDKREKRNWDNCNRINNKNKTKQNTSKEGSVAERHMQPNSGHMGKGRLHMHLVKASSLSVGKNPQK